MMRLLVTAGPTHEPIDPVRYLGNRSSGRTGVAIALEGVERGLTVDLLLGPGVECPEAPSGLTVTRFQTADDLESLLAPMAAGVELVIMTAAVADFRPQRPPAQRKLRRGSAVTIDLVPVPDLLMALSASSPPSQRIIGFALEHVDDLPEAARAKLERKGCAGIVANGYDTMDGQQIDATLLMSDGRSWATPGSISKPAFASWLLDHLLTGSDETSRLASDG